MFHSCKCFWNWDGEHECAVPHTISKSCISHQSQIIKLNGPKVSKFLSLTKNITVVCLIWFNVVLFFQHKRRFPTFISVIFRKQCKNKPDPFQCLVATGRNMMQAVYDSGSCKTAKIKKFILCCPIFKLPSCCFSSGSWTCRQLKNSLWTSRKMPAGLLVLLLLDVYTPSQNAGRIMATTLHL